MKKLLLFLPALVICSMLQAQTKIVDKQEVYGTWTKSNSPYIIEGEAIVPEGKTLEIKPGVIVQFKTGDVKDYRIDGQPNPAFNCGFLRVNGILIAKGKKKDLIKFTGNGDGTWGNVSIYSKNEKNFLQYCWFESAFYIRGIILIDNATGVQADNATGALTFNNATGTVKNCLFISNGWTAFNCKNGSDPKFSNNTVIGNKYGVEVNSDSKPVVTSCILWDNDQTFYTGTGGQIKISYSLFPDYDRSLNMFDDGKNIIGSIPEFSDQNNKDFSLKKSSPARKKGKSGNMGAL